MRDPLFDAVRQRGAGLIARDAVGWRDYNGERGLVPTYWPMSRELTHENAIVCAIVNRYLNH